MNTITSKDGTEIAYERTGTGPPLVLVHGSGVSDHRRWDIGGVGDALSEHLTVYALDRRGRGQSGDGDSYSLDREVDDVVAVIESIDRTTDEQADGVNDEQADGVYDEPITLLGHSLGANIALEAALRTDALDRLILYEPGIAVGDHEFSNEPIVAEMNDLLAEGKNEAALVVFMREIAGLPEEDIETFQSDPTWQDRVAGAHTIPREEQVIAAYEWRPSRFEEMTTPTLLLTGEMSPEIYRDAIRAVHEALPTSTVVTFENQQHVAMNTDPDRFVAEVLDFVRSTP